MADNPDLCDHLLSNNCKALAFLATLMKDGSPQVTPVWFMWDGKCVIINTARGRVKDRNMHNRHDVALAIIDPENPYRYIQIRGKVIEETEEGGWENINQLSYKYDNQPYPKVPGETRVIYKILPDKIQKYG